MPYTVTFRTSAGDHTILVSSEQYLIDAAEDEFIDLPYSCRAGACSTCAGKIISGTVDQDDQSYLDDDQMAEGYILTCVSKPTSDLVIQTEQEENLY